MQNFAVTNKEHYGMLWYFLKWSISIHPANCYEWNVDVSAYVCVQCAKLLAIGLTLKNPLILLRKRTQTALINI